MSSSAGLRLRAQWNRLSAVPGGSWIFSRLLALTVPYSGNIHPHVVELRPGHARVTMQDRRAVRNHLNSIHAIALVNLGELTSGLAMITALPPGIRSIVTGLRTEFLKKARGRLTAECSCQVNPISESIDQLVTASIADSSGEVVARVAVTWRLSPS